MLMVLAYYDKAISLATEYNVNLDILYFGGWHLFAIGVSLIFASMRRVFVEKLIFYVISIVFLFNLSQNIALLNHDYYKFKEAVNNIYLDQIKWVLEIGLLLFFVIWASIKFKRA